MVRVSDITDIPWVVSPKSTLRGWGLTCRNFFRESSWDQLMPEKERKQDLAEGRTGLQLSQHEASACDEGYSGEHIPELFPAGGKDESLDAGRPGEDEEAVSS